MGHIYYPIVTFTDIEGKKRVFTSTFGYSLKVYYLVQQVRILYNTSMLKYLTLWCFELL